MNLKKYIKLKAEPQETPPTPEEEELYNSLVQRVESNSANCKTVKRVSLWKIITPIVSFACAVAIILTCVFTLRTPEDFIYNDELIDNVKTNFSEMQADIKYFDIAYLEDCEGETTKYYYSSNYDKLYYTLDIFDEQLIINMVVVINEKYNYSFEIGEVTTKQLKDYSVTYSSESSRGKPQITYRGKIKVQTETVFFEYVQTPASGDEAFFETITQIIKVKQ